MAWDAQQTGPGFSRSESLGSQRRFPLVTRKATPEPVVVTSRSPSLAVRVSITFGQPLNVEYARRYDSSPSLDVTERISQGLLRRLEHCSTELITRKDSRARESANGESDGTKALRYEISFQVGKSGEEKWAQRSYKSYQRQTLTMDAAKEVILATDRMIGMFLRRHDKGFVWREGPVREDFSNMLETTKPRIGSPQPLCCVPRLRFIETTQLFELVPGYEIELSFRSRHQGRRNKAWNQALRVRSLQGTPLSLSLGEELLWKTSRALHEAFDGRKKAFDAQHITCRRLRDAGSCRHVQDGAVDITLRIKNKLGPDHDHLHRRIQSNFVLFNHPDGLDCQEFLGQMNNVLSRARTETDSSIDRLDDLMVKVHELRGLNWRLDRPLGFSTGPLASYSRRSVEAIVDRVQTGIADVLHGNNISITLSVHKRGHLILDKTLVAHEDPNMAKGRDVMAPDQEKNAFVTRIRERIRHDIEMVCLDTCSIDDELDCARQIVYVLQDHLEEPATRQETDVWMGDTADNETRTIDALASQANELDGTPVPQFSDLARSAPEGHQMMPEIEPREAKDTAPCAELETRQAKPSLELDLEPTRDLAKDDEECATPSTPSLVDEDGATPRHSRIVTPAYSRNVSGGTHAFDIRIVDDDHLDVTIDDSVGGGSQPSILEYSKNPPLLGRSQGHETPLSWLSRDVVLEPEVIPVSKMNNEEEGLFEGWLEYSCKPCEDDAEEENNGQFEGWLEYLCEPGEVIEKVDDRAAESSQEDVPSSPASSHGSLWLGSDTKGEHVIQTGELDIDSPVWDQLFEAVDQTENGGVSRENEKALLEDVRQPNQTGTSPAQTDDTLYHDGQDSPPTPESTASPSEEDSDLDYLTQLTVLDEVEKHRPPVHIISVALETELTTTIGEFPFFYTPLMRTLSSKVPATPPADLWSQTRLEYELLDDDDEDKEEETSPYPRIEEPQQRPKTAMQLIRPSPHRRQYSSPTAGYLGLHDGQQFKDASLRNVLIGQHQRLSMGSAIKGPDMGRRLRPGFEKHATVGLKGVVWSGGSDGIWGRESGSVGRGLETKVLGMTVNVPGTLASRLLQRTTQAG
jgi:hypothetical protein